MYITEELAGKLYANTLNKKYKELGETPKYILNRIEDVIKFYELREQMEEVAILQKCMNEAIMELLPVTLDEAYDIMETYCLAANMTFYDNVESTFIKHHLEELMDSVLVFERNELFRANIKKSCIYKEYPTPQPHNLKNENGWNAAGVTTTDTTINPIYNAIANFLKNKGLKKDNQQSDQIFAFVFDLNDMGNAEVKKPKPNYDYYNIKKSFLDFFVETTIDKRKLNLYD